MSHPAVIARPDSRNDSARWRGVHVHCDGYPAGVGRFLHGQIAEIFKGNLRCAAAYYIDAHPAGWFALGETISANVCYCHDRGEGIPFPTMLWDETEPMDWTYILRPEGLEIRYFSREPVTTVPWSTQDTDWDSIERMV